MLEQLIKLINSSIELNAIKNSYDSKLFGLTELVPIIESEATKLEPMTVNEFGECVKMSLDNTIGFQLYHRLVDKTPVYKTQQYGDSNKEITDNYGLQMFVIGNRIKLKQDSSQLSQFVTSAIPDVFKLENKSIALLTQSKIDFNSNQIINTEFYDYTGMPDLFIFRVDYNIRHIYRRKCLDACDILNQNFSSN
jgi:hypothetical protein